MKELNSEVAHAMKGRSLYLRVPILVYFAYIFVRYLNSNNYESILHPLSVGTYKLGYLVFSWMGTFMGILGGLILQLGAPIVAIFNLYFLGDFFVLFLSFGWLSTSFFIVARYVTDAYTMGMPLLGPFSERNLTYDWNYFLTQASLLPYAKFIAFFCNVLACAAMFICLIGGLWLLIKIMKNGSRSQ